MSEVYLDFQAFPVEDRDRQLGQFLDSWGRVEMALFDLAHILLRTDFNVARVVFANAGGIASIRELLLALGELCLSDKEQADMARILESVKDHNTKRNRIVHGQWMATIDGGDTSPPQFGGWVRRYNAPSPSTFIGTITRDDQKITANFTFTTDRIAELAAANEALSQRLRMFLEKVRSRFVREAQPPESSA